MQEIDVYLLVVSVITDEGLQSFVRNFGSNLECVQSLALIKEKLMETPSEVLPHTMECIKQVITLKYGI